MFIEDMLEKDPWEQRLPMRAQNLLRELRGQVKTLSGRLDIAEARMRDVLLATKPDKAQITVTGDDDITVGLPQTSEVTFILDRSGRARSITVKLARYREHTVLYIDSTEALIIQPEGRRELYVSHE